MTSTEPVETEAPAAPLQNDPPAQLPVETPTTTSRRSAQATQEAVATPEAARAGNTPVRSALLLLGLGAMGILVAGVVTTVLLYSVRNMRGR